MNTARLHAYYVWVQVKINGEYNPCIPLNINPNSGAIFSPHATIFSTEKFEKFSIMLRSDMKTRIKISPSSLDLSRLLPFFILWRRNSRVPGCKNRPKSISRDPDSISLSNSRLSGMVFCLKPRVCPPPPRAGKILTGA